MSTEAVDPKALDRHECGACGYIYEPTEGDSKRKIAPGTAFELLPEDWRCPVCTSRKVQFRNIGPRGAPSGFEENLGFGFGVNALTPGQKSLLIFGGLVVFFLFFISLYGLR
ncbi:MAG: rubredoxin [Cyanothece sp. SIO1E1]|nr:rubredoxin [Cyanothece sp. SIO1E1]